jgi:hypothetical protein
MTTAVPRPISLIDVPPGPMNTAKTETTIGAAELIVRGLEASPSVTASVVWPVAS